ncbi:unnamed protein product [Peronospora belbahrii]|uniref:Uncharacterized protein n=1 Tax=Peronospora belbahrii TaxID=622444 RepID=A0ABN8CNM3_9STRA|nr:unnamed protein product [Peronospora belbahrii]
MVERFMYSKRPNWVVVRWINVEGIDPLMMRRLAVRYRLHPLAVEDTLDADLERPKYEHYDEHSSLILQIVHARDLKKALKYQSMYRASLFAIMACHRLKPRMDIAIQGRLTGSGSVSFVTCLWVVDAYYDLHSTHTALVRTLRTNTRQLLRMQNMRL